MTRPNSPADGGNGTDDMDDVPYELLEDDPVEEALANCHGHYSGGVFVCGAAGSEECDFECPFSKDLGHRRKRG